MRIELIETIESLVKDKCTLEEERSLMLILEFKRLKSKINEEFAKEARTFTDPCEKILVLGTNYARLLIEVLDRSLDNNGILNYSEFNYVKKEESKLSIYGKQIYVSSQDDIVMLIGNLGNSIDTLVVPTNGSSVYTTAAF